MIHGMLCGREHQEVIDFVDAASCLKHTIERDFNLVSKTDVWAPANGDSSGRVQR